MRFKFILFALTLISCFTYAQSDTLHLVKEVPLKYLKQTNLKIEKYSSQLSAKTEKTLKKLSKWENKIKNVLLKADPAMAERLFGAEKNTFSSMLEKAKQGKVIAENYKAKYDGYKDNLETNLAFLETNKQELGNTFVAPLKKAHDKVQKLEKEVSKSDGAEMLIKERKKELISALFKAGGKNKYLVRINKESYYYTESIRNYKQTFSEPGKAEEKAIEILNKIPAFKKFFQQNSKLSGIFGTTGSNSTASLPIINGLSSRADLQQYFSANLPSLTDPSAALQQQLQMPAFKTELDKLSSLKMEKTSLPDFKPNSQKTKTFSQRIEKGFDVQFGKSINFLPASCNIGLKAGYKLNDRSTVGLGMGYILGLGKGWQNIKLTNEGLALRTYAKMKLIKSFDLQGGGEWNYRQSFKNIRSLQRSTEWQKSALIGINRTIDTGKKLKGELQLLFDLFYNKHNPVTQPVIFRAGYHF